MLNMCQVSSLMGATEGPGAEFSGKVWKKENEIEPFDVISENS